MGYYRNRLERCQYDIEQEQNKITRISNYTIKGSIQSLKNSKMGALALLYNVKARNGKVSISNKIFFRSSLIISSYTSRTKWLVNSQYNVTWFTVSLRVVSLRTPLMWTLRSAHLRISIHSRKIISPKLQDAVHGESKYNPNLWKKIGELMRRRQAFTTPYTSTPLRAKPQKRPRKNLIKLTPSKAEED